MWSQFAAARQEVPAPVAEAEEAPAVQQTQQEEDEQFDMIQDNNGWNDESFDMEDEQFDTIIDGDNTATDTNDNIVAGKTFTASNGWNDTLLDNDELLNSPNDNNNASDLLTSTDATTNTGGAGSLGKVAENFGAALLASLDDEEEHQQQHQQSSGGGGFGAGFVMKGLSRFIEAATVPQKEYEEHEEEISGDENEEGGGWDDDNLEMEDDDFDDGDQLATDALNAEDVEEKSNVPIVQNVVEEESNGEIISQEGGWGDDNIDINDNMFESGEISGQTPEVGGGSNGQLDFNVKNATDEVAVDSYEIDKDKSPEPVVRHDDTLPSQQSWYINAIEGGQGGVVYSEKMEAVNNDVSAPLQRIQGLVDETESVLPSGTASNVGMPISEMPSANTSPRSNSEENIAPITQCELKCECLKYIMPLPDNGADIANESTSEKDGFGTKKLQDGTTVLVNYEQLLLNEATKRILLERTAESYELRIAKLESKYQTTLQSNVAHEETNILLDSQLASANKEIAELKTLVSELKLETNSDAKLLEAKLSATSNEQDQLQKQVISLQEELKNKEDEVQSLKSSLAEMKNESLTLKSETEMLQCKCDELQEDLNGKNEEVFQLNQQCSENFAEKTTKAVEVARLQEQNVSLKGKAESLQEQLDKTAEENGQLKLQVSQSFASQATKAVEYERTCSRLENEISEAKIQLTALREENESLCNIQRESDTRIIELRATIESMDDESTEANDSVAEIAKLRYELETKGVECQESMDERNRMEHELSAAKSEVTSLREQNDELRATVEAMDGDAGEVDQLAAEVANLKYDLEAKAVECEESIAEKSQLEAVVTGLKAELATLRDENESLRHIQRDSDAQLNDLRATLEAMDGDIDQRNDLVAEVAKLKYELEAKAEERNEFIAEKCRAETQLSEINTALTVLKEENESLRLMQRDSDSQLNELRATIESMQGDTGEVDRLVAEVANLKYELEAKAAEREDNINALHALQAKLDNAEECLRETMNETDGDVEDALKADNYELSRKNVDLQGKLNAAENSRSDLQLALEEKIQAIEAYETQVNSLNAQLQESSQLQQEILGLRKSYEDKSQECEIISSKVDELKTALDCARTEYEKAASDGFNQTNGQISSLQAQIAELLKDHNLTMQGMEGRLNDASDQITNLSAQCDDYRQKLEYSQTESARLIDTISMLENEKVKLSSALEASNSALDEKQLEMSHSVDSIKEELKSAMSQNEELTGRNHIILEEKTNAIKALEAKTSEFEQELSRCNANIDMIKEEMESVTQQNKELIERNHTLQNEKEGAVKALASKITELNQEKNLFDTSHKANSEAQQNILSLEKQLQDLKGTNKRLESELFEASFAADDNEALMKERDDLAQEAQALREQVDALSTRVADASQRNDAFSSEEREALLSRVSNLEAELRACENAADLRDELTSIQEEREQLDLDNEELLVQLGLMQQDKLENEAARQVEIDGLREQVSNLKDKCDRLQNDLSSSTTKEDNSHEVIDSLREEIRQLKENAATFSKDISLLKLKLADKESEVVSIKEQMTSALNEKDEEIGKLLSHAAKPTKGFDCESIDQDDSYTKTEEEKECYFGDEDDDISLQGLLAEEADSDDFLRSQIVVLAQALERAELRRAAALERIISERKSNADIVGQLGLSVKRFYATIRRSDGL